MIQKNEAAKRLYEYLTAHAPWTDDIIGSLDEALTAERSLGRKEGRVAGRVDTNIGYREGYSAGAADARRATVERMLARFDAAWLDFDGAYGNPRPKWAIAKIRAAMADEEAAR